MELSSACNLSLKPNYYYYPTSLFPSNNSYNNLKASSYYQTQRPIKCCSYSPSKYCSTKKLQTTHLLGLYAKHKCLKPFSIGHLPRPNSLTAWSHQSEFPSTIVTKGSNFGHASWKFVRPIPFVAVSIICTSLFGAELLKNPNLFSWQLMFDAFQGLVVILLYHIYINGLNQIYDLESDRINKPDLPLAAEEMSVKSAWFLTIFSAVASLLLMIKLKCGLFLTCMYCCYLVIGAMYSVPPFRWKMNTFTSTLWNFSEIGIGINFLINYASRATLGLPFQWRPPFTFIIGFVSTLSIILSILKDVPDVEGDKKVGMSTLPVIFGARTIVLVGSGFFLLNYVAAIGVAIMWPQAFKGYIMIPAHAIFASALIFKTWLLDKANYAKEASDSYYHFLWFLMIAEYILYPFIST
ncbi:2-acyl-4-prenylphloroglucinol 6-prenyltransferase, chloroplastic [Humulus lupulus]|uniref:2-acyl-4-prenylphloroglucinol 6-prenyltransferase, chloroplastic n=1 Tax=Humulus lupulus TaxID=3486 RepID=PT2_HUMLU|nr:2-acyl-4-prenylphloroglucinol 6-prenyltransferase, chloroplastic [Humulus lupulus]A0A0B4ZTQ2.1 RecName: Full=2-acyl-4-prenylphloroglucinol 6-prenyltransferase, chloroplastic; AltName: Full=Aromatic prenyltransferase PT2; AltName: Full=Humulus lupulus prenyltransferase-2; Short=HlPT2; Flags: Precursor [Humulus lupulus]AJD80255.1 aromatic prenyltransferase HlPT [Humulus lupulus]